MNDSARVVRLRYDQRRRWREGEHLRTEVYLDQEPALQADPEAVLELIYNEIVLREENGERPRLEEYLERFPQYGPELRIQFEVHQALEEGPVTFQLKPEPGLTEPRVAPALSGDSVQMPGYEILGELGRGGMGVVYKARQLDLKRVVALKMVRAGVHAGPRELAYFRTEAEAVARLHHPHIVQIYEIGQHAGLPYFALEWVDGPSLDKLTAGRPIPTAQAAELVETLARAMHHAHQHGIIHRDLKPSNVLLAEQGIGNRESGVGNRAQAFGKEPEQKVKSPAAGALLPTPDSLFPIPKITDFGLAKLLDGDGGQTSTEAILGTPCYMAPEQAGGRPKEIGPGADIYALGAILYELLTGRPPFRGNTVLDTLEQVRRQEPPAPSRLHPGIPGELEAVCLKCLEKDSRRRYDTALALAEDLRRYLANEPVQARPASWRERGWKWVKRHPAVTALLGVSAAAVLALGALGVWHHFEVQAVADQARAHQRQVETARLQAARSRYRRFVERRDEALFHGLYGTLFTDADVAGHLQAAQSAVQEALAVVGVSSETPPVPDPYLSEAENRVIAVGCYQLLLVQAETAIFPGPRQTPEDQRRQVRQALQILDRAAAWASPTPAYHLRKARYLLLLKDEAGAVRERQESLRLQATTGADAFWFGEEWLRQGDLTQAMNAFQQALRLEPEDFWSRFFLAVCCLKAGRVEDARAGLSECLARQPGFLWTYLLLGLVEEKAGDGVAAEADYRKVLDLGPNEDARYFLHVNRGRMRLQQGQLAEAAEDLRQAIALKPGAYFAHLVLARVYQKQTNLAESNQELEQALRLWSGQGGKMEDLQGLTLPARQFLAEYHTERGRNQYLGRDYEGAVRSCGEAWNVLPGNPESDYLRARSLLELKRYGDARQAFDRYLEEGGPPSADFYRGRGYARAQGHDYLGAVDDYTRVLEIEPDADIYTFRGWAYYFTDSWKPAVRDFEEALRRDPGNSAAYIGRGLGRVMLGQVAEGVADAETAWRAPPQVPEMMHNLACIYALAAGKAAGSDKDSRQTNQAYRRRALEAIRQALTLVPPSERKAFWREKIVPDQALDPVRGSSEFQQLDREYGNGFDPAPESRGQ